MGETKRPSIGQRINNFVNRSVDALSNFLSKNRGLPMMVAVGLIAINALIVIVNELAQGTAPALAPLASTNCLLHVGLLLGFIGILLSEPLGRG